MIIRLSQTANAIQITKRRGGHYYSIFHISNEIEAKYFLYKELRNLIIID